MARAGFFADAGAAVGIRHDLGTVAVTATGERGTVERGLRAPGERAQGYSLSSLTAERALGPANLSLGVSRLEEDATVLGARFGFAPGGATSHFVDAAAQLRLGWGWDASASYRLGWTRMSGAGAMVVGGRLATDAWSFDLAHDSNLIAGDRFALRVTQPLRVRSGGYQMMVPTSWDYASQSAGYSAQLYSLAPAGREIDFEAAYMRPILGGAGWLSGNLFLRRQPGHIQAAPDDVGAAARFTLAF